MPRTKRSRSRESCRQLQNPHVCAKVRKAVMYWSTVSPSFCWRLLKLKRSYVSLVSPMQNSANFVITASRSLLFVSGSKYIPSYISIASSPIAERNVAVFNSSSNRFILATIAQLSQDHLNFFQFAAKFPSVFRGFGIFSPLGMRKYTREVPATASSSSGLGIVDLGKRSHF